MKYELLAVGTDAEQFLVTSNGSPVPVIGHLGGTKAEPRPVIAPGFAVQEDNVAAEYNVPPATSREEFIGNVQRMNAWLADYFKKKNLFISNKAAMSFTPKQLEHPQAQQLGCEPDWCVWTRMQNASPAENAAVSHLRTAAAHIHVSFSIDGREEFRPPPEGRVDREVVVKALDITAGCSSVLLDPDVTRRQLYGKAGAFRFKDYGIEYRVPSNFWVVNKKYNGWAWDCVVRAFWVIDMLGGPSKANAWLTGRQPQITHAINEGDKVYAYHSLVEVDSVKALLTPYGWSEQELQSVDVKPMAKVKGNKLRFVIGDPIA